MSALRRLAVALCTIGALVAAACSPEAGRKPGERGADVGNRDSTSAPIELHGTTDPSYQVPQVGEAARR